MALTAAGMKASIIAARASLPTSDGTIAQGQSQADAMLLAFCQGIINHIVEASELVPLSTDSGSAGAGIITGKIK
jgi:hypothetical protein